MLLKYFFTHRQTKVNTFQDRMSVNIIVLFIQQVDISTLSLLCCNHLSKMPFVTFYHSKTIMLRFCMREETLSILLVVHLTKVTLMASVGPNNQKAALSCCTAFVPLAVSHWKRAKSLTFLCRKTSILLIVSNSFQDY